MSNYVDPYDDAMVDPPDKFWGKVTVDAWQCVLEKGQGKVPYDPQAHKGRRVNTAVDFTIEPLNPTWGLIHRGTLNWTASFRVVIRPSIVALEEKIAKIIQREMGQFNPLRELSELYVQGSFVPRPDNKEGETWTTLRFENVFATEAECRAHYEANNGEVGEEQQELEDASESPPGTPPENPAMKDPNYDTFKAFLPTLWNQANHNLTKMNELLQANPMVGSLFSVDSPEVQELVAQSSPTGLPF